MTSLKDKQCSVCEKVFKKKSRLDIHMRYHTGERPYNCQFCDQKFYTKADKTIHENKHTGNTPYSCDMCDKKFFSPSNLYTHRLIHSTEKNFKCDLCEKTFLTKGYLRQHMQKHMEKKFQCGICELKFFTKNELNSHMVRHTGVKPYKCEVCEKRYANTTLLNNHMRMHLDVRPYQCKLCSSTFVDRRVHDNHIRTVHYNERPHKCNDCGKAFKQSGTLERHRQNVHLNIKPHICEFCGKAFATTFYLKSHRTVHTGELSYECDICNKRFRTKGNLNEHKESHINVADRETLFKCQYCEKLLTRKKGLKQHIQSVHLGVKAFYCELCDKSFTQRGGLKSHQMKLHSEKKELFSCSVCSKAFTSKPSLLNHSRLHSGEKPFECEFCGEKFPLSQYLRCHKRVHHEDRKRDFICNNCGKTFFEKRNLIRHIKEVHSGSDLHEYECEICLKSFKRRKSLVIHKRSVHDDQRPFQCDICGKRFIRKSGLALHADRHAGNKSKSCKDCGKLFVSSSEVSQHRLKMHTPGYVVVKPYVCEICGWAFNSPGRLKGHISLKHPTDESNAANRIDEQKVTGEDRSVKQLAEEIFKKISRKGHSVRKIRKEKKQKTVMKPNISVNKETISPSKAKLSSVIEEEGKNRDNQDGTNNQLLHISNHDSMHNDCQAVVRPGIAEHNERLKETVTFQGESQASEGPQDSKQSEQHDGVAKDRIGSKHHNTSERLDVNHVNMKRAQVSTEFELGDLVWAKLKWFPWWPGIVLQDPSLRHEMHYKKGKTPQVHVQFLDRPVSRSWVQTLAVQPFIGLHDPKCKDGGPYYSTNTRWTEFVVKADKMYKVTRKDRIRMVLAENSQSQHYKMSDRETDDISTVSGDICNSEASSIGDGNRPDSSEETGVYGGRIGKKSAKNKKKIKSKQKLKTKPKRLTQSKKKSFKSESEKFKINEVMKDEMLMQENDIQIGGLETEETRKLDVVVTKDVDMKEEMQQDDLDFIDNDIESSAQDFNDNLMIKQQDDHDNIDSSTEDWNDSLMIKQQDDQDFIGHDDVESSVKDLSGNLSDDDECDDFVEFEEADDYDNELCAALTCCSPTGENWLQCLRCDDRFHSECVPQTDTGIDSQEFRCFRCIAELKLENCFEKLPHNYCIESEEPVVVKYMADDEDKIERGSKKRKLSERDERDIRKKNGEYLENNLMVDDTPNPTESENSPEKQTDISNTTRTKPVTETNPLTEYSGSCHTKAFNDSIMDVIIILESESEDDDE